LVNEGKTSNTTDSVYEIGMKDYKINILFNKTKKNLIWERKFLKLIFQKTFFG